MIKIRELEVPKKFNRSISVMNVSSRAHINLDSGVRSPFLYNSKNKPQPNMTKVLGRNLKQSGPEEERPVRKMNKRLHQISRDTQHYPFYKPTKRLFHSSLGTMSMNEIMAPQPNAQSE